MSTEGKNGLVQDVQKKILEIVLLKLCYLATPLFKNSV